MFQNLKQEMINTNNVKTEFNLVVHKILSQILFETKKSLNKNFFNTPQFQDFLSLLNLLDTTSVELKFNPFTLDDMMSLNLI